MVATRLCLLFPTNVTNCNAQPYHYQAKIQLASIIDDLMFLRRAEAAPIALPSFSISSLLSPFLKSMIYRSFPTRRVKDKKQKHTTGGIPRWSPTLVLVARFSAYVWQSGRDAQFSLTYGRMCSSFRYFEF
jgi:hypothetical protein